MNIPADANLLPLNFPPGIRLHQMPGGGAVGRFLNVELGSVFQPLIASDARATVWLMKHLSGRIPKVI
jgi:hypothetical protein